MWVNRQAYDGWQRDIAHLLGKNEILERENVATRTTLDWLTVRVTQLEKERAALLFKFSGVVIETPVISSTPPSAVGQNVPLDALPIFDDMGEDAAKKLGIGWNADGTVAYK